MKKQLFVLAVTAILTAVPAQAALVTYSVAATFTGGGTVTGTIDIDTLQSCSVTPRIGYLTLATTSAGDFAARSFNGFAFSSCSAFTGEAEVFTFELANLSLNGNIRFDFFPALRPANLFAAYSFTGSESQSDVGLRQFVGTMSIPSSAVSEPTTLALVGLALAACALGVRRA
jgi:hypothetical protein